MKLTIAKLKDGETLLTLEGRMDIEGSAEIDLMMNAATAQNGPRLIADLSAVSFMATIGIGTLVRVAKAVRLRGGNLVILNPQTVVRLVLEKTRINEIIEIKEALNEALTAVRNAPHLG